uniref:DUF8003 domain-containing protein n=1 Tax=Kalanchoe fedtschenkoi TaxID=63787 RepID=A0A7N0V003_KALFE
MESPRYVSLSNRGSGRWSLLLLIAAASAASGLYDVVDCGSVTESDDFDWGLESYHNDYAPPAPPPPPPPPPSVSCVDDLGGIGTLDTVCKLVYDLELQKDVYIAGEGNLYVLPGVRLDCAIEGCEIVVNISGDFSLGANASISAGTFLLEAGNASFGDGSVVNTTGLAGDPPVPSSGTPQGLEGAGGGHGGRGACCLIDKSKSQDDVWGGDAYSWSSLQKPWSYGSQGGSTSKEIDYGGKGGGRVKMVIDKLLDVNGSVLADGAGGGNKGGGGSGGSIYVKANKSIGTGRFSACGGDGFAGGGGGRVAVDIFSRHDEPRLFVHGGNSFGCEENAGAAGTFYDAVPRSLIVSNHNRSTDTDTLLMEFPYQPLLTNVYVRNKAKASVPLLWSRVQVQGQIKLESGGILSFGLAHYSLSEFELLAEELLMSDSVIKVYGALRMTVKMFLMWNSKILINGGGDSSVATSLLEGSNLVVLKESSVIRSNANLGVHGQGLLNLSGPGDLIEAQRLVLSLFYSIHVGPGSILRGPLENATIDAVTPRLNCDRQDCPFELLHPPDDCNVNSSLSFTLQICRVEDVTIEGLIKGSVVHFHRARTLAVQSSGTLSASGMGCTGGIGRGNMLSSGIGGGAGHGGKGGAACYNGTCVDGGISYGRAALPCELGSGSGEDDKYGSSSTTGGGVIVVGSMEHPLSTLSIDGSVEVNGESSSINSLAQHTSIISNLNSTGGGSGGTVLLFLGTLDLGESAVLSSAGGHGGSHGSGGGGGGRIHFHWSDIPTGDVYQPIASVKGAINTNGGLGKGEGFSGGSGSVTGRACPKGLYGIFCEECPTGTYKNVTGSDKSLCRECPANELPRRASYITVRGGVAETPCPYQCISDRYHMPHCYTTLEELIYTFGGPWLFALLLLGALTLLALVLSVARMKFVGVDELSSSAPRNHGSLIDHSFPFLESLNEVLETNRMEESQSHVHRMYFMGLNTFRDPWHLPHSPPDQVHEIVYEGAFNRFVDEINALAAYQWWEGSMYSILSILAYPLAWSWLQWRRRLKLQRLREFVRSEYDHACLRSCRSRALYEGIKVAATSDLMLAFMDFFLGGDEKRPDLPPRLQQRFPLSLVFGGDGSYMAPFSLHNDNILTNLMSQAMPPTTWYRLVAGLNAQLRLVCRGRLRSTFRPFLSWLETHANPALKGHRLRIDLVKFQATTSDHSQYGLLVNAFETEVVATSPRTLDGGALRRQQSNASANSTYKEHLPLLSGLKDDALLCSNHGDRDKAVRQKRSSGEILDVNSLRKLNEERYIFFPLSFILHNTKPVGHQDLVGLVISMLLLGDFSLALLTLLQLYSISLADVLLVLFILPLGIILPFPAGINALFSHGPRRSAGLARFYALWNLTSLVNIVVAFICGYVHYSYQPSKKLLPPWNINMDGSEWWIFPGALVVCKCLQSRLINWHVANLEIQDRSLYSANYELFWQS